MAGLSSLSPELHWDILLRMDAVDMLSLCQVNWQFANICESDDLWKEKTRIAFGLKEKPASYPRWKDYYIDLSKGRIALVPVTSKNVKVGGIWIRKGDFARDIANRLPNIKVGFIGILLKDGEAFSVIKHWQMPIIDNPSNISSIEVSESMISPITLRFGSSFYNYWATLQNSIGELIDYARSIHPNLSSFKAYVSFFGYQSFAVSDDPASRARPMFEVFRSLDIVTNHPIILE